MSFARLDMSMEIKKDRKVEKIAVLKRDFSYSYPSVWTDCEAGGYFTIKGEDESFGNNLLVPEGVKLCRGKIIIVPREIVDIFEVVTEVTTTVTKTLIV